MRNTEWWKRNRVLVFALLVVGFMISISDRIIVPLPWWQSLVLIFSILFVTGGVVSWVLSKTLKHYKIELKAR